MDALIIDDQPLIQRALEQVLKGINECMEVAAVSSLDDASELLIGGNGHNVRMIVLSHSSHVGMDSLEKLTKIAPDTPIVVASSVGTRDLIHGAFTSGAKGVILKTDDCSTIENVFRLVLNGGVYVHPNILSEDCASQCRHFSGSQIGRDVPQEESQPFSKQRLNELGLSNREQDVARLLAAGRSNKFIAQALGIAESTTKVHVAAVMKVLRISRRAEVMSSLVGIPQ